MSTNIIKTNGEILTVLQDNTVDTNSSSIILVGRNIYGYGSYIESSMIRILENFCNTTSPLNPLTGQEWFNSTSNKMTYYNNEWINILDNNDLVTINTSISNLQNQLGDANALISGIQSSISNIEGEITNLTSEIKSNYDLLNSNLTVLTSRVTALETNIKNYLPLSGGEMTGTIIVDSKYGITNKNGGGVIFNDQGNIDIISNTGTYIATYNLSTSPNISVNFDIYGKSNIYMGANSELVATQPWTEANFVYGTYDLTNDDYRIKASKYSNSSLWVCYDENSTDQWIEIADKNWVNTLVNNDTFIKTSNGYQIFKSGLILQWGSGTSGTVNFPITFPNKALQIFASNTNSQGWNVDNAFAYIVNNSQYYIETKSSGKNGISGYPTAWFALGY